MHFRSNSRETLLSPVTLPPGRARLLTRPEDKGSPIAMTMDVVGALPWPHALLWR